MSRRGDALPDRRQGWGRPLTTFVGGLVLVIISATLLLATLAIVWIQGDPIASSGAGKAAELIGWGSGSSTSDTPWWIMAFGLLAAFGLSVGVIGMTGGGVWTLVTAGRVAKDSQLADSVGATGREFGRKGLGLGSKGVDTSQRAFEKLRVRTGLTGQHREDPRSLQQALGADADGSRPSDQDTPR